MNALHGYSAVNRATSNIGMLGLLALITVVQTLRLVLFAILALFEPVARWLLSLSSLVCFLTCGFYALVSPPGMVFPYALGFTLGTGCAVFLALYELLLRALNPG